MEILANESFMTSMTFKTDRDVKDSRLIKGFKLRIMFEVVRINRHVYNTDSKRFQVFQIPSLIPTPIANAYPSKEVNPFLSENP